jgi:hypothetical protein
MDNLHLRFEGPIVLASSRAFAMADLIHTNGTELFTAKFTRSRWVIDMAVAGHKQNLEIERSQGKKDQSNQEQNSLT